MLFDQSLLAASTFGRTLDHLRAHRPCLLHALDPFKVPLDQAVDKATAVRDHGFPALILASTDWADFSSLVGRYVEAIREVAPELRILLHFPPRPGHGMPMVAGADATLYPFLLGSTQPYFVWQSYAETAELIASQAEGTFRRPPELIHLAALTFGVDHRSRAVMALEPVAPAERSIEVQLEMLRVLGLEGAYLFSRHEAVPDQVCRRFRDGMSADRVLFVSGGVRTPERANRFLDAGADFVVFCGALECDHWEQVLDDLVRGWRGRSGAQ